ncbi:MAG: hypothetical protein JST84_09205 [Acidobacteria bacterium]|nr:hypothetical protein [Acidobacteriota bacterium]
MTNRNIFTALLLNVSAPTAVDRKQHGIPAPAPSPKRAKAIQIPKPKN